MYHAMLILTTPNTLTDRCFSFATFLNTLPADTQSLRVNHHALDGSPLWPRLLQHQPALGIMRQLTWRKRTLAQLVLERAPPARTYSVTIGTVLATSAVIAFDVLGVAL